MNERRTRMFDSVWIYKFLAVAFPIFALNSIYFTIYGHAHMQEYSVLESRLQVVLTVIVAVCVGLLLLRTSNAIERMAIVVWQIDSVLSIARQLNRLGYAWATVPDELVAETGLFCVIAVLAIVRAFQVTRIGAVS
jgi:hypothetical protein